MRLSGHGDRMRTLYILVSFGHDILTVDFVGRRTAVSVPELVFLALLPSCFSFNHVPVRAIDKSVDVGVDRRGGPSAVQNLLQNTIQCNPGT